MGASADKCRQFLESGKGKVVNSPPEFPEGV
jgi:hypothetical protein